MYHVLSHVLFSSYLENHYVTSYPVRKTRIMKRTWKSRGRPLCRKHSEERFYLEPEDRAVAGVGNGSLTSR